jgi:catechol 2,3-dioxygenase-like lactoylglutathione lyase family enzyme
MGTALLLVACIGSLGLQAQTQKERAEITGIANVAFRVSDLDREIAFLGKLGFEEAFTNVADGKIERAFVKINDRQYIELYPQTDSKQPLGWVHVCYESESLKELNAKYAAQGLKPTPVVTSVTGNLLFSLVDPDGREIHFSQYMPGSRHTKDRGQHLGAGRASDQLIGFEAPVKNLNAAKTFAATLGFDEAKEGGNVRLSIPSNQDLTIVLHPARVGDAPQFLLPVEDARKTADVLRSAGLKVERHDKLVFVRDPDGNTFVLMQTTKAHRSVNLTPWRHKADE